jgi:hypothetical protein
MGLDRASGAKTIRRKLAWLAAVGELIMVLGRHHAAAKPHALGFLYVDGHARAYYATRTVQKTHVAMGRTSCSGSWMPTWPRWSGWPELKRKRQELDRRHATLLAQQRQLKAVAEQRLELRAVADGIEALCQTIRAGLATATFAQRRLLAELLIDRVVVTTAKSRSAMCCQPRLMARIRPFASCEKTISTRQRSPAARTSRARVSTWPSGTRDWRRLTQGLAVKIGRPLPPAAPRSGRCVGPVVPRQNGWSGFCLQMWSGCLRRYAARKLDSSVQKLGTKDPYAPSGTSPGRSGPVGAVRLTWADRLT